MNILGSGGFQFSSGQSLHHNLHQPIISKIFAEFLIVLSAKSADHIQFPKTENEIIKCKRDFFEKYGFPNVVGAIDGTHIPIQKPAVWDAYCFYNRKQMYSINVQAVCDANYIFTDVVGRWPGSTHDSHIYKTCGLYNYIHSDLFPSNSYLLGDSGYPLEPCLLTPVLSPNTPQEMKYNEFHKKTRKIIEMAFGILKSRFRILHKTGGVLRYSLQKCIQIIICCFILHNIAMKKRLPLVDEECGSDQDDNDEPEVAAIFPTDLRGRAVREVLINYNFV